MAPTADVGPVTDSLLPVEDSRSAFSPIWPVSSYQTAPYDLTSNSKHAGAEPSFADWQLTADASHSLLLTFSPPTNVPLFAVAAAERVRSMNEHQHYNSEYQHEQLDALYDWRRKLAINMRYHFVSLLLLCCSRWWWTSLLVAMLVIAVIAYIRHNDMLLTSKQMVTSAVGILLLNVTKDVLILLTAYQSPYASAATVGFFSSMILLSVVIDAVVVTPLSLYYCHRLYSISASLA